MNGRDESTPQTTFVPDIMVHKKAVLAVRNEGKTCAAVNNSLPQQCVCVTFKFLLELITRYVTLYFAGVRKKRFHADCCAKVPRNARGRL